MLAKNSQSVVIKPPPPPTAAARHPTWKPEPAPNTSQPIEARHTRYHASPHPWPIRPALKHCKVPKYYDQDSLKIFPLLSTLPAMIRIPGKNVLLVQKS